MRNLITTTVSVALLSVFGATSALAGGTSVYNSYKTTNEHGSRQTTIDVQQENYSVSNVNSQSLKIESNLGDLNISNLSFDGSQFTGNAHSSNQRPVDPVVIGTFVNDNTTSINQETVNVNTVENVQFNSSDYTHTVGNNY